MTTQMTCDGCAGQGDNPNCMCGGTGSSKDAVVYLREQFQLMSARAQKAELALKAESELLKDGPTLDYQRGLDEGRRSERLRSLMLFERLHWCLNQHERVNPTCKCEPGYECNECNLTQLGWDRVQTVLFNSGLQNT